MRGTQKFTDLYLYFFIFCITFVLFVFFVVELYSRFPTFIFLLLSTDFSHPFRLNAPVGQAAVHSGPIPSRASVIECPSGAPISTS